MESALVKSTGVEESNVSEIHGRGLVCRSPAKKGTTLVATTPLAAVVERDLMETTCSACFARLEEDKKGSRCSKCKMLRYCGQDCQRKDWQDHKDECASFVAFEAKLKEQMRQRDPSAEVENGEDGAKEDEIGKRAARDPTAEQPKIKTPSPTVRLAARLLRRRQKDPALVAVIGSLVSNKEKFSQESLGEMAQQIIVLREFLGDDSLLSSASDMIDLFCRLACNCFHVCDDSLTSVGVAFYPAAHLLNHSCSPNSLVIFDKDRILIRSSRDIPANEEVTIPYVDVLKSRGARRKELKERYFFDCSCERCLFAPVTSNDAEAADLLSRLSCENKCGALVQEDSGGAVICPSCGVAVAASLNSLDVRLRAALQTFQDAKAAHRRKDLNKSLELLGETFKEQQKALNRLDSDLLATEAECFEVSLKLESWDECLRFGTLLAEAYLTSPFPHPMYGVQLLFNGKILLFMGRTVEASRAFESAAQALSLTHGSSHPILTSQLLPLLRQAQLELAQSNR